MINVQLVTRSLIAGLLGLFSISVMASPAYDGMKAKKPEQIVQAPDFALTTLDQKAISLSDYKGKVVVLNFWATYCIPCRIEMPSLEKLSQKHQDNDVAVVAISLDEGKEKAIQSLVKKMDLTFPIAMKGQSAGDDYQVSVLPVTYIIGKQGELLARVVGDRDWASEEADQLVEAVLAGE
ncbi:TlpA disulfide reductase family protein [Alkalimarinus sediminis]|uniref:TlpA family protein disulfide reductase n=1 Tax=Alkalimarinus sediminis TaxID=1632866 RepID=A0A9E8KJA5_9ALTE|nr:TlpA disulfide reductase family protein [Alkalimarinus sediminis]UZW74826.1 TlpA family protein disulfide reductase [Alkalimarinus sediminis]